MPPIPLAVQGMERIRALFLQYITLTQASSLECLLGLEILIEKEKLGLPSFVSSNDPNIDTYSPLHREIFLI